MSGSRCQSTAVPAVEDEVRERVDSGERQRAAAAREERDDGA
jgi:hypothetical protein